MKEKLSNMLKNKKIIITVIILVIIIAIIICFTLLKEKYDIFLELNMPKDSYGYIVYSPGNESEFNLFKDSYLNIEYSFSDKKDREINYVIEDENILYIKDNKVYAKDYGTTKIYIKTQDNNKSNIITINVVKDNE